MIAHGNNIKIFTDISKEEIDSLIAEHQKAPHRRSLQRRLAEEVTTMVHSHEALEAAIEASNILFGNSTADALRKIDEETLLQVFEGVPQFTVSKKNFLNFGLAKCETLCYNAL